MIAGNGASRGARGRYVRLWVERIAFIRQRLTLAELGAYTLLEARYTEDSGHMADDDDELADITTLSRRKWLELKAKLLHLGVLKVEAGRLVDADQDISLEIQQRASNRGRAGGLALQAKRRA